MVIGVTSQSLNKIKYKGEIKMARYTYRHIDNGDVHVTICYSTYAGKMISGKAYCAPGDTFDPEIGERVARARLDKKVQKIRIRNHTEKIQGLKMIISECEKMIGVEEERLRKDAALFIECENILRKY